MSKQKENPMNIAVLSQLHESMLTIRACETALVKLFASGDVPGFIHLSHGQEAVAVGVCSALGNLDTLVTTHRGHGHVLARGIPLDGFFKELMGRSTGICKGRSGSMHVADLSIGVLGANGIVGASLPIALGSALAHQVRKTGGVAVAFFGDGAMAEGVLHESLNMAALWQLPMIFACENNGWSEFSPTDQQFSGSLKGLASAFNIKHSKVNGNDLEAVADASDMARAYAGSSGPIILECMTTRFRGHFEGDAQKYRVQSEIDEFDKKDPINQLAKKLTRLGVSGELMEEMSLRVEERVSAAIDEARVAPLPEFGLALQDVYSDQGVKSYG
jgi:pyruvate dehydrogenase E1 component alpha subunit